MKPEQFADYFENPQKLDSFSVITLEEVLKEYPFCQPAQLFFLKGLQNDSNLRFNRQLKIAAAYAASRRVLFELLDIPKFAGGESNAHLREHESTQLKVVQPAPAPEAPRVEFGKPDLVHREENFLRISDLDLIRFDFDGDSDDDQANVPAQRTSRKTSADELIDRFIENPQPRVIRPDHAAIQDRDVSLNSAPEEEFLTETLARIYVEQGYFLKAIHAYEKLCLKIPEKSAYFASQVEMVRELFKKQ